jgi:hypothetical protein
VVHACPFSSLVISKEHQSHEDSVQNLQVLSSGRQIAVLVLAQEDWSFEGQENCLDTNTFFFVVFEHENNIGLLGWIALPKAAATAIHSGRRTCRTGDMDWFTFVFHRKSHHLCHPLVFCD